jgi:glycerate kinase
LGAALEAATGIGAQQCLMGIGGSATNDGGFAVARARGWTFLDERARQIDHWRRLDSLQQVCPPMPPGKLPDLLVAVDVQNPLLGAEGATRIYGPQKGLRPEDLEHAENCLRRLAEVAGRDLGSSAAAEPGAGAAGGLGFGMRCFFGARLESGFDIFARDARLRKRIQTAELVITGEGAIDASTLMGKGVGEIARLCNEAGVPCLGLAGTLRDFASIEQSKERGFARLFGMAPRLTTSELAIRDPQVWLPRLAAEAARNWTENQ